MARRQRIRQAIDKARGKPRTPPASPPLGDRIDDRSGTPPSAPVAAGQLSGAAAPAPAWESPYGHLSAREVAGAVFLLGAPQRRWAWFLKPSHELLFWMGKELWPLRFNTGVIGLRIELWLYYARMSLIMWITGRDTHVDEYTLSRIDKGDRTNGHP